MSGESAALTAVLAEILMKLIGILERPELRGG
jgi:hypothetical protein